MAQAILQILGIVVSSSLTYGAAFFFGTVGFDVFALSRAAPAPAAIHAQAASIDWREVTLPAAAHIEVPFVLQAPEADWAEPWQNFCEEAVITMAEGFAAGAREIPPLFAKARMVEIMHYENAALGFHIDAGADEIALVLKHFSRIKGVRVVEATALAVKEELVKGNLVIIPAAGALLKNKYFRSPPLYHTVVVTGYDDERGVFFTHDPGTQYGAQYPYDQEALIGAIRDFSQTDGLVDRKVMIVVPRPTR